MNRSYNILNDNYLSEEKKKLYVSILELLYTSRFDEAYEIIRTWSEQEQTDFAIEEAYESENISIICFAEFLITKENSYFNHTLAAEILRRTPQFNGEDEVAYYHVNEALRRRNKELK